MVEIMQKTHLDEIDTVQGSAWLCHAQADEDEADEGADCEEVGREDTRYSTAFAHDDGVGVKGWREFVEGVG